jgi:hypothetical protein
MSTGNHGSVDRASIDRAAVWLAAARAADSARRHQRVLDALTAATCDGASITVSSIARRAGVHRSFIHRHPDLHAALTAAQQHLRSPETATKVSDGSLRADMVNLQAHNRRLVHHIAGLEARLSEALGTQVYQASGIGAPDDTAQLHHHVDELTQRLLDVQQQLDESTDELAAARAANRELMAQLNRP